MKTEIVTITPEMAREMLKANKSNRTLRKSKVLMYAHDMKNGKWNLTGQGITFGKDGRLLDGQHRLQAIAFANVPIKLLVVTDADIVGTYDCGIQRTFVDQFKLANEMNTGPLYTTNGMAICRLCYQIEKSGSVNRKSMPTISDLETFILDNKEGLDWAAYLCDVGRQRDGGVSNGLRRAIITATIYEVCRLDIGFTKAHAERFIRVLRSGLGVDNTDAPIIALRNKIISMHGTSDAVNRELFLRIQWTISKYLEGSTQLRSYFPDKNVYEFVTDNTTNEEKEN